MPAASKAAKVTIAHRMRGRVRFRVHGYRGRPSHLGSLAEKLRSKPNVTAVQSNPVTGTLLVHHTNPLDSLLEDAKKDSLLVIAVPTSALRTVSDLINDGANAADRWVRDASNGQVSLPILLALTFLGLALLRMARGEFRVSTVQLLLFAVHAATMSATRRKAPGEALEAAVGEIAEE